MRGFRPNSKLGKCTFCSDAIVEGKDNVSSRLAKITYGKWICGGCLYGMRDAVNSVVEAFDEEIPEPTGKTFKVDPATGKLTYKYPVALDETGE